MPLSLPPLLLLVLDVPLLLLLKEGDCFRRLAVPLRYKTAVAVVAILRA
jgi:hypothetical protein